MHQITPSRRASIAPRLPNSIWPVAVLVTTLACGGDPRRNVPIVRADSSMSAIVFDTGAPAAGARIDRDLPAEGDSGIDPMMGTPGALAALKRYFSAINERRFHDAYVMWADRGAASGISFEEFAHGYDHTRATSVVIGRPGRVEGAAGSRYVDVPVSIEAVTLEGEHQHYRGGIVLRRVVVPGADSAERRWHLYSAAIDELP
jgi:hypothetical protein